jgi:methionyl-tRNA formyltransferase
MIRALFLGTAEIACPIVQTLHEMPDVALLGVISQPDRPQGRKMKLTPTPIKSIALDLGLEIWQPERLRKDPACMEWIKSLQLDVAIVMAYGQILPVSVLQMPKFGCLNIHTSLLPHYRGAAPIQWAIWTGDEVTGVTLMQMDKGMDTGPIVATSQVPITPQTTAPMLHDQLAEAGADLLKRSLADYCDGKLAVTPQPEHGVSHARKIEKQDGAIDWTRSAVELDRQVRALSPWPGCFTDVRLSCGGVERLKIKAVQPLELKAEGFEPGEIVQADKEGLIVKAGHGALRLLELQRQGGKAMDAKAFLLGMPLASGDCLVKP